MNTTLIIQNLDEVTLDRLRDEATQRGLKLEEFVRQIIYNKIQQRSKPVRSEIYHDLDSLAGTWSKEEVDKFTRSIMDFNKIDERLWQ